MVAFESYASPPGEDTRRRQNAREILKKLIMMRFSYLDEAQISCIDRADLDVLDLALVRILAANTPDEII